ncbi:MAG: hypothetical protein IKX80_10615 [Lachnospiraceae bacterium]|nr:hypothetical protein [Lachnospiraceae bacterium]
MLRKPDLKRVCLCVAAVLVMTAFSACSHKTKDPADDTTATPTQQTANVPATPTQDAAKNSTPTPAADAPTPTLIETPAPTDEPLPTLMEDDPDDDDSSSVAGSELKPTAGPDNQPATPTPAKTPAGDTETDAQRSSDWQETFLVWIPEFTGGMYHGYEAEETFDRASFAGVDPDEVLEYIAELEAAGFTVAARSDSHASRIAYSAMNADNWAVEVEYGEGFLKIGSGYYPDTNGTAERLEHIWTVTALAELPRFESGNFASDAESSDGSSHHAIFEDVTEDDVRAYALLLAQAGYTVDADEGDSDGFIWYSAENADGGFCDLTYYDGILKIEGGR